MMPMLPTSPLRTPWTPIAQDPNGARFRTAGGINITVASWPPFEIEPPAAEAADGR